MLEYFKNEMPAMKVEEHLGEESILIIYDPIDKFVWVTKTGGGYALLRRVECSYDDLIFEDNYTDLMEPIREYFKDVLVS